jgi:hypothetical protein
MSITTGLGREEVGRNVLYNSNFDIWQRGTSGSGAGTILADRWYASSGCESNSRGSATSPTGSTYYAIYTRTTASSGSLAMFQRMESAVTKPLEGKTVTLSFQFRQTAGTTLPCKVRVDSANAVDNYSGITNQIDATVLVSPTSSWQSVSYSFVVNTTMANNGFQVVIGNIAATGPITYNLSQVKLEVGSVATPFSLAGGDYAGELQKCIRYYERRQPGSANFRCGEDVSDLVNRGGAILSFSKKRATPTISFSAASTFQLYVPSSGTTIPCTSISAIGIWDMGCRVLAGVSSGISAGNMTWLQSVGADGFIAIESEL